MVKHKAKVAKSEKPQNTPALNSDKDKGGVEETHEQTRSLTPYNATSQLLNSNTTAQRQVIFRSIAGQFGNAYATKLASVMRSPDGAAPQANLDALDSLMGLTKPASSYNDEQLKKARQLALQESDGDKRAVLFKLVQQKVPYHGQNDNESLGFNPAKHQTTKLGVIMCNLTSLAMTLEGIGITFSMAEQMYPDTFDQYKASIENERDLSPEDRQKWADAIQPATQYEDFLEQMRVVHKIDARTSSKAWDKLSDLLGAKLTYVGEGQLAKDWWVKHAEKAFGQGSSVLVGVDNHIIRLQSVNDDGLVFDDPNARLKLGEGMTTRDGQQLDMSWDYKKSGNDTFVPWNVAEAYNFRWVRLVTATSVENKPATLEVRSQTLDKAKQADPTKEKASPDHATSHDLIKAEEQPKVLAALRQGLMQGLSKNALADKGYFAIRGEKKIDPSDKHAVAEWLYIRDTLLPKVKDNFGGDFVKGLAEGIMSSFK